MPGSASDNIVKPPGYYGFLQQKANVFEKFHVGIKSINFFSKIGRIKEINAANREKSIIFSKQLETLHKFENYWICGTNLKSRQKVKKNQEISILNNL